MILAVGSNGSVQRKTTDTHLDGSGFVHMKTITSLTTCLLWAPPRMPSLRELMKQRSTGNVAPRDSTLTVQSALDNLKRQQV